MATSTNFNCLFETLHRFCKFDQTRTISTPVKNVDATHDARSTRRSATIGLAMLGLAGNATIFNVPKTLAEDNGFWITGPLPVPQALNNINNEETGTRSFLKKGIYIADVGTQGRMRRLKRYAFDLVAMADLIAQRDVLNYVRRYLRLKSTFMYYDFDKVISAATANNKPPLIDLANRLFNSFEKLEEAVKEEDFAETNARYLAMTPILQEVIRKMDRPAVYPPSPSSVYGGNKELLND